MRLLRIFVASVNSVVVVYRLQVPKHNWYCKSCVHAAAKKGVEIELYYNNDCAWHLATIVECTSTLNLDKLVKITPPRHLIWFRTGT